MKKTILLLAAISLFFGLTSIHADELKGSNLKAELKIGTGIEKYDVVGESNEFTASTGTLVAWSRIEGASEPTKIYHVWLYGGKEIAKIELAVKTARYRTYSRIDLNGRMGSLTIQVNDTEGNILATKEIVVK